MTALIEPPRRDPEGHDGTGVEAPEPLLLGLDDPRAVDPALTGGKAAALARARQAGLDTVAGLVLTTAVSRRHDAGAAVTDLVTEEIGRAVAGLTDGAVAVRSSSVVEDGAESSAAGQFESVLDVRGPAALVTAVEEVLASRERAGAPDDPIAVLVQPMVEPDRAGVAFGVDPVSGRSDRRVVTAVEGSPAALVSGEVDGGRWVLDDRDAVVAEDDPDDVGVGRDLLYGLTALLHDVEELFGGPQDVEWAQVGDRLVLLQSRPVTTVVRGVPAGPIFGPGPVAETFPEALAPLEEDLWVPPLRDAVREAIRISGSVPERALAERELVVVVGGRVAIDLEATGEEPRGSGWRHWFGVGAKVRRLRSAWRVGRLRAALPLVADELAARLDTDLEEVPALDGLTVRQLVALVDRGREALRSLHAHEILLGLISDPGSSRFTGGSVALRVLAEARHEGMSDDEIVRRAPVVLALVPPGIGRPVTLPSDASAADLAYDPPGAPDAQVRREALRLRVRWVQELTGQAAFEIGRRLQQRGILDAPDQVQLLRFDEVTALVAGRAAIDRPLLDARSAECDAPPSLPARFRMGDRGLPIAVEGCRAGTGTGAGGGVGQGPVTHDATDPPDGAVLVVEALSPGLGPLLPRLTGLVSETGSVLSHLAILAREAGVPTVVGRHGSVAELAEGTVVRVDGQSGEVTVTGSAS
ncbi:MAG TPA: PEP/pyruvate-binding domain-containing protein [Iamia sp.]